ncbi:MAG: sigma-70 family RNA polymerase sigma factor, partial [Verrucomicrobia bacterium]|nr:sigma-70 family RNA polymerase sigma factor [Verrucomicrobiota bacterium]
MEPDGALLRRYAETGDEVAFAELVRRQLGLVYGAALRQVGGDAHRAQEVAQAVFSDLARKAGSLADRPVLASWLHTSTRFAAAKLRRAEVRRWKHEQEAGAMSAERDPAAEWDRLRPVIDEAVQALGERDREAVLQRFFANRAFAEIGAALGVTEDAARMRVERALEKLRGLLARRGVTSTAAALGVVLESHAGTSVPAGMVSAVAGQAVAGGASAAGTTLAEALGLMSTMKLAGGVAAGLLLVAALGPAV